MNKQEFIRMDEQSRKLGGTTNWNYILNDFI